MHIFRMMVGSIENKNAKIGTGSMGRPMIAKRHRKDYEAKLTINIPKLRVMAQGTVGKDTRKATGMEIGKTGLRLANHVRENMMVQTGALAGRQGGQTWIDTSTKNYHNTEYIAELAAQLGIDSVEAHLSNLWQMGYVEDDKTNASLGVGFVCEQVWTCLRVVTIGRISLVAQPRNPV